MKLVIILGLAALALAGCAAQPSASGAPASPSQSPSASPSPSVASGPGVYRGEVNGASIEVTVPGAVPADVTEVLGKVGQPVGGAVSVKVDNRKGASEFYPYAVDVLSEDGTKRGFIGVSKVLASARKDGLSTEDYNATIRLSNADDAASVGEVRTWTLIGGKVPSSIAAVEITVGGKVYKLSR